MTDRRAAVVTAAGKGIGAAIARELAAQGYDLALMSQSESAESLTREIGGLAITGSVTNSADLERLVSATVERYGRIDAVVNNTGHPAKGDLLAIADEDWHAALDLLLLNVIRMARLVTPIMLRQGKGTILNISAMYAYEPSLSYPVSNTMRAALGSFAKMYADQYAAHGIRMNNILPGFVENYALTDEARQRIPMHRAATLDEIARTSAFLLSDDAGYITGQNLRVDGGLTRGI